MPKTIGILGGMGPESTVEFMRRIIKLTPATRDQEHIRILVDNRPQIPDRTTNILDNGPTPLPMMQESVRQLEAWGADMVAIPCNTAHYYVDAIQEVINIPLVNIFEQLAKHLRQHFSATDPVAVLATNGSIQGGVFHKYLEDFNLIIPPDDVQNDLVMASIFGEDGIKVKGNTASGQKLLRDAVDSLADYDLAAVIAGCTEISVAIGHIGLEIPIIDPLDLLTEELVRLAMETE